MNIKKTLIGLEYIAQNVKCPTQNLTTLSNTTYVNHSGGCKAIHMYN